MQHIDEQGRLTGQTVFQQAIPADRIQDGRVELNLTIDQQLSYSGAYRLVLEKVTPVRMVPASRWSSLLSRIFL